jgi:hypothetical protein
MSKTDLAKEIRNRAKDIVDGRIQAFFQRGDMSIWKNKQTMVLPYPELDSAKMRSMIHSTPPVEIEDLGDVQVEFPMNRIPPYNQIVQETEFVENTSSSWLLDEIAPAVFPQELPVVNPDTDKNDVATQLITSIKPAEIVRVNWPEKKKLAYKFIDYRFAGNPLMLLFGACIECYRQHHYLPDILYISKRLEPALERESMQFYGNYDMRFRLYHPKALAGVKKVPVFTESHLPKDLLLAFESGFSPDCVIAVVEK